MNENKISIIVPIYNTEEFLEKCIKSIISQTYSNLEIILVNDGSTDESLSICEEYSRKDDRIIVIDKENGGVSSARNKGLDVATGNLIGFVDSDDYISQDMYEKLNAAIVKSDADVAECGYYVVILESNAMIKHSLKEDQVLGNYQCSYNYLSKNNTTNFNVNKLFKKELFKNIRYQSFSYSEDYVLNSKIFYNCNKKTTINDCLYYYVKNQDSATNQSFNYKKLDMIYAGKEVYNFYKLKDKKLSKFTILYILNIIRKLYEDLIKSDILEKEKFEEILINEYKSFYFLVKTDLYQIVKYKKTFMALWLFYRSPKLYYFIERFRGIKYKSLI